MKSKITWLPIPGISGYLISEHGTVVRLQYFIDQKNRFGNVVTRDRKQRIVKTRLSSKGYMRAAICFGGKIRKEYTVHRLVCMAFHENPKNYDQVNHKDGNKLNNHYSNLEWCDASHNIQHAVDTGLLKAASSWLDTQSKPITLNYRGKQIWVFGSIGEASKLIKIKRSTISRNCKSKKPICRGRAIGHKFNFYETYNIA